MITTGIIKKINVSGGKHKNNKVIAEVSLFKSPGDINSDVYSCECNCSVPGGIYSPYNVGDKVYIGFLNGKKTNPIILGKIYQGLEDESRAFAYFSALKVRDQVNLPENTLLGDLKVADIKNLDTKIDNLNVIANRFPNPPIVDGEYNLRCSVSGNEGTTINSKFISGTPSVKKSIRQSIQTKCGNSVVVNQLVVNLVATKTVKGVTFTNNGDGTIILNGTATEDIGTITAGESLTEDFIVPRRNNKCLVSFGCQDKEGIHFGVTGYAINKSSYFLFQESNDTDWNGNLRCYILNGTTFDNFIIRPTFHNLTKWFGSNDNIPQDLLNNPSHFSWYYNGDLSYNTGTLINATGRYLECGQGRNLWDEEWGNYLWDETDNGIRKNNNGCFGCNDFINVSSNTTYYFRASTASFYILFYDNNKNYLSHIYIVSNGTFNTPANCRYITFYSYNSYGTTYNHDITISLYYTPGQGGEGYDKYYQYIAPKVVDTGNEILRSAGSIYDYKTPDGTITRRVGRVDLGTLDWEYNANYTVFLSSNIPDLWYNGSGSTQKMICSKYVTSNESSSDSPDKTIYPRIVGVEKSVGVKDSAYTDAATFKAAMSGVILYYELETPTTEQGTSFQEDITINDYSYMLWKDANNNLANIPQGCDIFYLQKEGGEIRYYWAPVN